MDCVYLVHYLFWYYDSGVSEDSNILRCYAIAIVNSYRRFQKKHTAFTFRMKNCRNSIYYIFRNVGKYLLVDKLLYSRRAELPFDMENYAVLG
jgi:hypothetical protein